MKSSSYDSRILGPETGILTRTARPRAWEATIPVLAFILLTALWSPALESLPLDDAYIHLVYARNLAAGQGLCFNIGEPSTGTSSPLWVLFLAVWIRSGLPPILGSLLGGWIPFLILGGLFYRMARELADAAESVAVSLAFATLSVVALDFSGHMAWMGSNGMETMLFTLLGLLAIDRFHRRGIDKTTTLFLALALWTRVTALPLFVVIALAHRARTGTWDPRRLGLLASGVFSYAPIIVHSWWSTGHLLPSSMGGKLASYVNSGFDPRSWGEFILVFFFTLRDSWPLPLMVAPCLVWGLFRFWKSLGALALGSRLAPWSLADLLACWSYLHFLMYVLVFPSTTHHGRYFTPVFAASLLVTPIAIWRTAGSLKPTRATQLRIASMVLVVGMTATFFPYWRSVYRANCRHVDQVHRAAARWLVANAPPGAIIAAYDIGALGYESHRPVLDLFGLLDPESHSYLKNRNIVPYLFPTKPDYFVDLRMTDAEMFAGIFRAEATGPHLIDLEPVAAFTVSPYPQPMVTHAFGIQIYQVRGWNDDDPAGRRAHFIVPEGAFEGSPYRIAGSLGLVRAEGLPPGGEGTAVVTRIRWFEPGTGLRLVLYWQRLDAEPPPRLVTLALLSLDHRVVHRFAHEIGGALRSSEWRPGEILRDPTYLWIPPEVPEGRYVMGVAATQEREEEQFTPIPGFGSLELILAPRERSFGDRLITHHWDWLKKDVQNHP